MAPSKPMLGDIELQQVEKIEVDEDQVLAQQSVPALEGDFLQKLGRRGIQISLTGVLTGTINDEPLTCRVTLPAAPRRIRRSVPWNVWICPGATVVLVT